ncbi:uncharacterized protein TNCV_4930601 [Trichonephila clavipes]|nr:uncharacterized protein TNCV_4930601 [Trichonephila clavipes]
MVQFSVVVLVEMGIPDALHMKVRREPDRNLNLDSSESILPAYCDDRVRNIASSLLQANLWRHYCQIPVLIRRCNSGATCIVTSPDISLILESLPKTRDDTLGNFKLLVYFHLCTSTFQTTDNSTT